MFPKRNQSQPEKHAPYVGLLSLSIPYLWADASKVTHLKRQPMKPIIRTEIQPEQLETYLNNLVELYDIVHLSHSTYIVDVRVYHSVIALVKEEQVQPFDLSMALEKFYTGK